MPKKNTPKKEVPSEATQRVPFFVSFVVYFIIAVMVLSVLGMFVRTY